MNSVLAVTFSRLRGEADGEVVHVCSGRLSGQHDSEGVEESLLQGEVLHVAALDHHGRLHHRLAASFAPE